MILSLGSLAECPLTISGLVRSTGPEAPDDGGFPLLNVGARGTLGELNASGQSPYQTRVDAGRRT